MRCSKCGFCFWSLRVALVLNVFGNLFLVLKRVLMNLFLFFFVFGLFGLYFRSMRKPMTKCSK